MDHFVEKTRVMALRVIVKAYKPSLGTEFVAQELAFDSTDEVRTPVCRTTLPEDD